MTLKGAVSQEIASVNPNQTLAKSAFIKRSATSSSSLASITAIDWPLPQNKWPTKWSFKPDPGLPTKVPNGPVIKATGHTAKATGQVAKCGTAKKVS
jgi:hypothetical protein